MHFCVNETVNDSFFLSVQNLNQFTHLESTSGIMVPAIHVFCYVLRFFKDHALKVSCFEIWKKVFAVAWMKISAFWKVDHLKQNWSFVHCCFAMLSIRFYYRQKIQLDFEFSLKRKKVCVGKYLDKIKNKMWVLIAK